MASLRQKLSTLSLLIPFLLLLSAMPTNAVPTTTPKISLPPLSGSSKVGTMDLKLTDNSRTDPFAPGPPIPRSIMIQLFYPAKNTKNYPLAPYMSPAISTFYETTNQLPNGTLSTIQPHSHLGAPIDCISKPGVILFSTMLEDTRKMHTVHAEDLASHGFIVILLDHLYESGIVEFPDGTTVFSTVPENQTDAVIKNYSTARLADTLYVLNSLTNITARIPGMQRKQDLGKVGILGHSLGGSTAANLMLADSRVVAGVNMDGMLRDAVVDKGLDKPFLIMGAGTHYRSNYTSWGTFWNNQRGWKKELHLEGAQHRSFSDIPVFVELLGYREQLPKEFLDEYVGTLNGLRGAVVQKAYLEAFFKFGLRGEKGKLLAGPDKRYEEMVFVD